MKRKITLICVAVVTLFVFNACHGGKKVQCDSYGHIQKTTHQEVVSK